MKGLSLVLVTVAGLLPVCLAGNTHYECSNPRSRWEYWWYSVTDASSCPAGTSCPRTAKGVFSVPWALTKGDPIDYRVAEQAAKQFDGSYTYTNDAKYNQEFSFTIPPGETWRLWLKQWFVLSDLDCTACTDIGTCSHDSQATTTWVPCTNSDCVEWQTSDAYARCDSGNNCSL